MIEYRNVNENELNRKLFSDFVRHQTVAKCFRWENGQWVVKDDPFTDDWSEEDYGTLIFCLRRTLSGGGFVYGAFDDGRLKGFVSVEPKLFGGEQRYLDLSSIHVSEELRGRGIGKMLFSAAKQWAKEHGAKKLYISSHSAYESQMFYRSMGCVEAAVYEQSHVEAEPYDCQLECKL